MDNVRKERLCRELKQRFEDAERAASALPADEWARLESMRLTDILSSVSTMSRYSPVYRRTMEAVTLLFPYREAWKIVGQYRREILEADSSEQDDLLDTVLVVISESSRMNRDTLTKHIYAFWPVPQQPPAGRLRDRLFT